MADQQDDQQSKTRPWSEISPPIVRHADHETQWRYMVEMIGRATGVPVANPPDAVDEVRRVVAELKAVYVALAAMDPWISVSGPHGLVCHFCRVRWVDGPTHEPDCLWWRAKQKSEEAVSHG